MKKITITLVTLFAAMSMQLSAQATHEFSAHVGGGLSTLSYLLSPGNRSGGFGGDFGFGYTYLINKEQVVETGTASNMIWGIHTGIGIGLYNSKAKFDNVKTITKGLNDGDATFGKFDLHTTLSNYNEIQNTMFLNIPVMAMYQMEQFYIMGGFKVGIPLSGKYKSKDPTLKNSAYYPDLDNWIDGTDAPKFMGLGTFSNKNYNGKLDLGVAVMLALEAGMKWNIADNLSLYTGAFFDYGLNNVVKGGKQAFINYTAKDAENFTTNSVLSSYTDNSKSSTFTNKANMMAVGIKVRLALVR